jgi:hypothetical protein
MIETQSIDLWRFVIVIVKDGYESVVDPRSVGFDFTNADSVSLVRRDFE